MLSGGTDCHNILSTENQPWFRFSPGWLFVILSNLVCIQENMFPHSLLRLPLRALTSDTSLCHASLPHLAHPSGNPHLVRISVVRVGSLEAMANPLCRVQHVEREVLAGVSIWQSSDPSLLPNPVGNLSQSTNWLVGKPEASAHIDVLGTEWRGTAFISATLDRLY